MRALYLVSNMRKNNIKDKVHNIICPLFPVISQIQHETCINIHPTKKHFSHFPTPSRNEFVDLKKKQVSWNVCIFFLASSLEKLRSEKARGLGKWIPPQGRPGLPAKDGKGVWSSFGDSKVLFGKTEIHGFFTWILIKEIKCVCEDILNF